MAPEPEPFTTALEDPFIGDATIAVVLWDDTVEVVNAGFAGTNEQGSLVLFAGTQTTEHDLVVATYAPDTWRSWYSEANTEGLMRAMAARHPVRVLRGALGQWLVKRFGYDG